MVSSGGKSNTDFFAWALLQVYYQNEIPFPVLQLKTEKLVFHEFDHYKVKFPLHVVHINIGIKQEMELLTWGLSSGYLYGL